jgi:hypothetical protein
VSSSNIALAGNAQHCTAYACLICKCVCIVPRARSARI